MMRLEAVAEYQLWSMLKGLTAYTPGLEVANRKSQVPVLWRQSCTYYNSILSSDSETRPDHLHWPSCRDTSGIIRWTVERRPHASAPLVLQFFVGARCTIELPLYSTLIMDILPNKAGTVAASDNTARCTVSAITVAVLRKWVRVKDGQEQAMFDVCVKKGRCLKTQKTFFLPTIWSTAIKYLSSTRG